MAKQDQSKSNQEKSHSEHISHGTLVTTDHETIRQWAEERDGKPSHVKTTGSKGDVGIIRIDFPGFSGEGSLEEISWEDWFEEFDKKGLALIYQETTASGESSNFNKLVSRDTVEERLREHGHAGTKR